MGTYSHNLYATKQIVNFLNPASPLRGEQVPKNLQREAYLINNTYPAPQIRVKQNEIISLTVFNQLDNETISIHWHGQRQFYTPWADGAGKINQCPMESQQKYFYNFTASDSGTYWYHGHLPLLYQRGLLGAFIVEDPEDPYKHLYQEEKVWIVNDWYRDPAQIYQNYNETNNDVLNPKTNTSITQKDLSIELGLINGMWGNGTKEYPYPTFNVETGKCYRIRTINSESDVVGLIMYISNHSFNTIAYNAVASKNTTHGVVYLYNSERHDGIVCASDQEGDYKITYINSFAQNSGLVKISNTTGVPVCLNPLDPNCFYAIWRVRKQKQKVKVINNGQVIDQAPHFPNKTLNTQKSLDLKMKEGCGNPSEDEFPQYNNGTLHMLAGIRGKNFTWFLWNYQSRYVDATTPYLQSKMQYGFTNQTYHYNVELNSVYDIHIDMLANNAHPLHMHGNRFWILGYGFYSTQNVTMDTLDKCNNSQLFKQSDDIEDLTNFNALNARSGCVFDPKADSAKLNYKDPFYADTVQIPPKTWTVLRVKFDNPGPWLFHCHVQDHQNYGFETVIVVGDPQKDWPIVPSYVQVC